MNSINQSQVYNYTYSNRGTFLPRNCRVKLNDDARLVLGQQCEINLDSPYITSKFETLPNGSKITIGRDGDIKISDKFSKVSRKHLTIEKTNYGYLVQDISRNGTNISDCGINQNAFFRYWGNEGKKVNQNYIKTARETRSYIGAKIDSGEYTKNYESYKSVINEAHKRAYCGTSGKDYWYQKNGQYLNMNPYIMQYRPQGACNNYAEIAAKVEQIAKRYNDEYSTDCCSVSQVRLKGIDEKGLPVNIGTVHMYASSDYTEQYLEQMYRTAKEAIDLIKHNAPKEKIIYKIAEHYQYAANARPYTQINNSLFMTETNTLLQKAGMNPITQGILDHAAQRMQPETFKQYFLDNYLQTQIV